MSLCALIYFSFCQNTCIWLGQCFLYIVYIYIVVEKSPISSHMYDHGFMDNTRQNDASLTSWGQPFCKHSQNGCLHDVRDASFVCDLSQFLTAWRLVLSMKPWSYIWLEIGLFSTTIAIIRACACWALFVITLTKTVHLIYIYIYITSIGKRLLQRCDYHPIARRCQGLITLQWMTTWWPCLHENDYKYTFEKGWNRNICYFKVIPTNDFCDVIWPRHILVILCCRDLCRPFVCTCFCPVLVIGRTN